ncbi:MAG: flippase [Ignavibacteriaceae bacterium]|nr:flippase [Ignavibacteriaceae bacterium]
MKYINNNAEDVKKNYSVRTIAKNTIYNLFGYVIPLVIAVIFIPFLIRGLGNERFGILNIAWIVIGYFSFFDFGIGKGLTKVVAEKIGVNQLDQIPGIFWTSLLLMMAISIILIICLFPFVPALTNSVKISQQLHKETLDTFYILLFSIPIVSTTAGLRGVLEAYQQFYIINVLRILLGVFTFLGPILVAVFIKNLFWVVCFLVLVRLIIWVMYLFQCFKSNNAIKNNFIFDIKLLKPLWKFSIWITVANIVGPIILYSDRFIIVTLISAAAVAYYSTPFEVITKLLVLPGALTAVLFPIFSASFNNNQEIAKNILLRGIKTIFVIIYPIVFLIILFAFDIMKLWLGYKFASNSSLVLQYLALGILMNSMSSIPNNFFQGIGKPKIPTIINLLELPIYLPSMWFAIKYFGINGAAISYFIAAGIDAFAMFVVANKLFKIAFKSNFYMLLSITLLLALIFPFIINGVFLKIIIALVFLIIYLTIVWNFFLSQEEKLYISAKLKIISLNN